MIDFKGNNLHLTRDEFHATDKKIMRLAFDLHNGMGRFFDEKIYQNELISLCKNDGLQVESEVEIVVRHKDFFKRYYIDMLVESGCVYEIKTVESIHSSHTKQLINYLLLIAVNHGKIINFRSSSLEYEFVSTSLNKKDRYDWRFEEREWISVNPESVKLKDIVYELLQDWGCFLDISLFNEAIIHFLGGYENVVKNVEIIKGNKQIGKQKFGLLNDTTTFHLSAIKKCHMAYEINIRQLLKHTHLQFAQWINFSNHTITLKTIKNEEK